LARGALADALELVAPFHYHQRVGREQVVQAKRLKLALAFEAIDVEVEELDGFTVARAIELVDEREGGTGDLVGLGGVERLRNALYERGFARAQIAAEQQQLRRREQIGELAAHGDGACAALRSELVRSAFGDGCGVGHCSALTAALTAVRCAGSGVAACNAGAPNLDSE